MVWEEDTGKEEPEDKQKIVYTKDVITTVKETVTLEDLYRRKQDYEREIAYNQAKLAEIQADIDEIKAIQAVK